MAKRHGKTQKAVAASGGLTLSFAATNEPSPTSQQTARSALADAASHLRASLRADGSLDGQDDFDRAEKEWRYFRDWAQGGGLILPQQLTPPERAGGREHDVRYEARAGLWWKYTKPNLAGYTVSWANGEPFMHNASPLEYLERLLRQNEVFGDDLRLAGLWNPQAHDWCIVTTQPNVVGDVANLNALQTAFEHAQFQILPWRGIGYAESLAARKDGIDVWDIHPANVLVTEEGLPLPLDVMLTPSPAPSPGFAALVLP